MTAPGWADRAQEIAGVRLDDQQRRAFTWFGGELLEWNQRSNLTSIEGLAQIEVHHFLDSLSCLMAMGANPAGRLVDVGSGAGFPGIPLKIARPALVVTLVEATRKKVEFCRHVAQGLALAGLDVLHARAEEAGRLPEHRAAYDWAVARAVGGMATVSELVMPFLKVGGLAIAQRGEAGEQEARGAAAVLDVLGGRVHRVIPVRLPEVGPRFLVVIEKTHPTPEVYPRRPGVPAKRPLQSKES